jgi:hypothetical protein
MGRGGMLKEPDIRYPRKLLGHIRCVPSRLSGKHCPLARPLLSRGIGVSVQTLAPNRNFDR